MSQTFVSAGAQSHAPPRPPRAPVIIGEFQLNRFESFRAEIIERRGKQIVAITRWKETAAGARRTSSSIEFGIHRAAGMAQLMSQVLRAIDQGAP